MDLNENLENRKNKAFGKAKIKKKKNEKLEILEVDKNKEKRKLKMQRLKRMRRERIWKNTIRWIHMRYVLKKVFLQRKFALFPMNVFVTSGIILFSFFWMFLLGLYAIIKFFPNLSYEIFSAAMALAIIGTVFYLSSNLGVFLAKRAEPTEKQIDSRISLLMLVIIIFFITLFSIVHFGEP